MSRAPVGFGTSFVQQVKLLGWSGRWAALMLGLIAALVIAVRIDRDVGLAHVHVAAMFSLPAAALWAFAVWHGEVPYRRGYHWSLPVPRAAHDLARVAAGALWLLLAYVVFASAGALVALGTGKWQRFAAGGAPWVTFFAGPLVIYALASPLLLWSDSPTLRRILVVVILGSGVATVFELDGYIAVLELLFGGGWGFSTAVLGGFQHQAEVEVASGTREAALWLGLSALLTFGAAWWRPADVARKLRRA